jgi:hypothetical protein
VAEELRALADLAGWAIDERQVATYAPDPDGWRALVRPLRTPGRSFDRYHVAVVDGNGQARYTKVASTLSEARRLAETHIRART